MSSEACDPTLMAASADVGAMSSVDVDKKDNQKGMLDEARGRVNFLMVGFFVLYAVFAIRLLSLGLEKGLAPSVQPAPFVVQKQSPVSVNKFSRKDILDRNGEILATSLEVYSLGVNPRKVKDVDALAEKIAAILPELDLASLRKKLARKKHYIRLHHKLTPRQAFEINALGTPALSLSSREERIYPQGRLGAHVLGFVNVDGDGLAGIEHFMNDRLKIRSDNDEKFMQLSIDMNVQHALANELQDAKSAFDAKGAAGLIMDVHTGELLALASLPDFDPNIGNKASGEERRNRATKSPHKPPHQNWLFQ